MHGKLDPEDRVMTGLPEFSLDYLVLNKIFKLKTEG